MNFLEKDLETIIWESPNECEARGLNILQMGVFSQGRRFRQMQLGPYGIADLINVYYNPFTKVVWVQVIECKRGKVNGETYLQAKRYATAVKQLLMDSEFLGDEIYFTTVLIGDSVDPSGPLCHVVAQDPNCHTFTYSYAVDGIKFHSVNYHWRTEVYQETPSFLGPTIRGFNDYRANEDELATNFIKQHGDYASPLLINTEGVLLNTGMLL